MLSQPKIELQTDKRPVRRYLWTKPGKSKSPHLLGIKGYEPNSQCTVPLLHWINPLFPHRKNTKHEIKYKSQKTYKNTNRKNLNLVLLFFSTFFISPFIYNSILRAVFAAISTLFFTISTYLAFILSLFLNKYFSFCRIF